MTKQEFINNVIPVVVRVADEKGYKFPSAIIAQFICESNWGQSQLSSKWFNFAGMKCGSSWKGASVNLKTKEEYKVGTLTTITDNFRAYSDIESGVRGYFDFIQMPRYKNLKDASSAQDYIAKLKQDGWATSSTYINTLTNILVANNLKQYDYVNVIYTTNNKDAVINAVKKLQEELNKFGNYGLVVDGIMGNKTIEAYNKFRG